MAGTLLFGVPILGGLGALVGATAFRVEAT